MKIISAGWRMEYIEKDDDGSCIFCKKIESSSDEDNFIVRRGRLAYIIMNIYPYTTGHLMVAPYRHVGRISDLTGEESAEIIQLVAWSERLLGSALHPDGFNVGMNVGKCAGAGYPNHIHMHIVPRWQGDTNFMPVVSESKVLPETLSETYSKIMKAGHEIQEEKS
jgi:ATP adenylyltransferase